VWDNKKQEAINNMDVTKLKLQKRRNTQTKKFRANPVIKRE